ncbi:MAG TPA: hypothetical protein PKD72_07140, partial [Gemmatales bacterium]|nr:hypothetical protein [Gemmatales bacterium]
LAIAGGGCLGYFSHLLLDEIYAIGFHGIRIKPNQFSGTAFKLFHPKSWLSNVFCWSLCLFFGSRVAVNEGYMQDYLPSIEQLRVYKKELMSWAGYQPIPKGNPPNK